MRMHTSCHGSQFYFIAPLRTSKIITLHTHIYMLNNCRAQIVSSSMEQIQSVLRSSIELHQCIFTQHSHVLRVAFEAAQNPPDKDKKSFHKDGIINLCHLLGSTDLPNINTLTHTTVERVQMHASTIYL